MTAVALATSKACPSRRAARLVGIGATFARLLNIQLARLMQFAQRHVGFQLTDARGDAGLALRRKAFGHTVNGRFPVMTV
jgi:hypothetical protein